MQFVLIQACKFPHRQLLQSAWIRKTKQCYYHGWCEGNITQSMWHWASKTHAICSCVTAGGWMRGPGRSVQAANPDLLWEPYSLPRGAMMLFQQTRGPQFLSLCFMGKWKLHLQDGYWEGLSKVQCCGGLSASYETIKILSIFCTKKK